MCVCVSKRENHPFPQEGGWEIEWPYVHKGKTILFHGGGGFLPGPHGGGGDAKNHGGGGGDAEAEGYPVPQGKTAGDILFHRGGGGAGRIHHDVHYLKKEEKYTTGYRGREGGGGGEGGGPAGAQPYIQPLSL